MAWLQSATMAMLLFPPTVSLKAQSPQVYLPTSILPPKFLDSIPNTDSTGRPRSIPELRFTYVSSKAPTNNQCRKLYQIIKSSLKSVSNDDFPGLFEIYTKFRLKVNTSTNVWDGVNGDGASSDLANYGIILFEGFNKETYFGKSHEEYEFAISLDTSNQKTGVGCDYRRYIEKEIVDYGYNKPLMWSTTPEARYIMFNSPIISSVVSFTIDKDERLSYFSIRSDRPRAIDVPLIYRKP